MPDPLPLEKRDENDRSSSRRPPTIDAVCSGDIEEVSIYSASKALNRTDPDTGMSALHVAVGLNRIDMVKCLVEAGALFFPDYEGRMPSLIAALCETSEEMQDYIAAEERKAEIDR
jgi:ankyrin repeat protein